MRHLPMKILLPVLFFLLAIPASAAPAYHADPAAVALIHSGIHDCKGCNLAGADLTNTCVKAHNLSNADFDGANATLMCMSYANFSGASFRGPYLSGANLAHADVDGANFTGANLNITSFKGTDLRGAKGLTQAQLRAACGDTATKPPAGMTVPICQ